MRAPLICQVGVFAIIHGSLSPCMPVRFLFARYCSACTYSYYGTGSLARRILLGVLYLNSLMMLTAGVYAAQVVISVSIAIPLVLAVVCTILMSLMEGREFICSHARYAAQPTKPVLFPCIGESAPTAMPMVVPVPVPVSAKLRC